MEAARNGESTRTVSEAVIRRASRTVSEAAIRRAMLIALCLLPAAGSPPAGGGLKRESAMGVNEHGAYDFRAKCQMPPPIPMPPRSFFEVASLRVRLRSHVHFLVCCGHLQLKCTIRGCRACLGLQGSRSCRCTCSPRQSSVSLRTHALDQATFARAHPVRMRTRKRTHARTHARMRTHLFGGAHQNHTMQALGHSCRTAGAAEKLAFFRLRKIYKFW